MKRQYKVKKDNEIKLTSYLKKSENNFWTDIQNKIKQLSKNE